MCLNTYHSIVQVELSRQRRRVESVERLIQTNNSS